MVSNRETYEEEETRSSSCNKRAHSWLLLIWWVDLHIKVPQVSLAKEEEDWNETVVNYSVALH